MTQEGMRVVVTQFDVAAIGDDWETLVSAAIPVVQAHDMNRWTMGALGAKLKGRYGESSFAKFSREIGLKSVTIFYDYTAVYEFYEVGDQAEFPTLTWSHFRTAMSAKTHDAAMTWLAKAADQGWTVEDLAEAIKVANGADPKPQKLIEFGGQFWECRPVVNEGSDDVSQYEVVFRTASPIDVLTPRQLYTTKVFGSKPVEDDD